MIVKTGANYQNDGGYIEASKTGTDVTVTIDGDNYNFKSDADNIDSLYKTKVSLSTGVTSSVYCVGLGKSGDNLFPTGANLTTTQIEKYAGEIVGIYCSFSGGEPGDNPTLAEGSHNTVFEKISASGWVITAIGPDAVAIIKEGD